MKIHPSSFPCNDAKAVVASFYYPRALRPMRRHSVYVKRHDCVPEAFVRDNPVALTRMYRNMPYPATTICTQATSFVAGTPNQARWHGYSNDGSSRE